MPTFDTLTVGTELPSRSHTASNVSLFLYNAAIWNPHRIHYDENYTREVEKHPGIVIDGPLQGSGSGATSTRTYLGFLGDPRTWGATFRYNF